MVITGGIPAWSESSAAAKAVKGVSSEGFMTTVQPLARAGPTWNARVIENKVFLTAYINWKGHVLIKVKWQHCKQLNTIVHEGDQPSV